MVHDGVCGEMDPGMREDEPSVGEGLLLDGAQFCCKRGLSGFGWQLVLAPVASNRMAS